MSVQFVFFLVLHLICTAVPQTILTITTDPICPNRPVVFSCTVQNVIALRWLVDNNVQVIYMSDGSSTNTTMEGIEPSLNNIQPDGTEYDFTSTLTVSNASVLVGQEVICDGGGPTTAESQTVEFSSPPMPPEYNCTLTGQRKLRLEWIDNNMTANEEYQACSCIGGGCSCEPTRCGDLNNNVCVREFEADQVPHFTFTAVNCGSQESTVSTLTVDARADPPPIKVSAWYNQSTGQLCNIAVTWDTVAPISIPVGCVQGVAQQYNVHCGDNFERLGLPQSTICNGGMCQFESPASTGCTLSVDSVNVMGTRTTNLDIPSTTPLKVTISNERRVTCNMSCIISYGTDPDFETLPNITTSDLAGVELMVSGEEIFYVASTDIGSRLTVKVKGSLQTMAETFDLAVVIVVVVVAVAVSVVVVIITCICWRKRRSSGAFAVKAAAPEAAPDSTYDYARVATRVNLEMDSLPKNEFYDQPDIKKPPSEMLDNAIYDDPDCKRPPKGLLYADLGLAPAYIPPPAPVPLAVQYSHIVGQSAPIDIVHPAGELPTPFDNQVPSSLLGNPGSFRTPEGPPLPNPTRMNSLEEVVPSKPPGYRGGEESSSRPPPLPSRLEPEPAVPPRPPKSSKSAPSKTHPEQSETDPGEG